MGPSGLLYVFLYVLAATCVLQRAAGARTQEPQPLTTLTPTQGSEAISGLNTYYFDALKPQISLSTRSLNRPERTALTVKLISPSSVSTFMPVVNPKPASGMTHSVSRTWQALKNLAVMFGQVKNINRESPAAQRLFPRAFMAVTAASDNSPVKLDLSTAIRMAEAKGLRASWAEVTPSSVLLLPFGHSTGAVADVMDVTYNEQADEISLELDVVHHPHTISEFKSHDKQTLDVEEAHYHFDTAPGVKVDAQALLHALQAPDSAVEGLHMFVKGLDKSGEIWPCTEISLSTDANNAQAAVGSLVQVMITATGFNADCLCEEINCCSQERGSSTNPGLCELGCEDYPFCCGNDPCCRNASGNPQDESCNSGGEVSPTSDNPGAQQAALSAKSGSKSRVTPPAAAKKHTKRTGQRRDTTASDLLSCILVELEITGDAEWAAIGVVSDDACEWRRAASNSTAGLRKPAARQPSSTLTKTIVVRTDFDGAATAWLRVIGTGRISVSAVEADSYDLNQVVSVNITGATAPGAVTHIKLQPSKSHKDCGDPSTILATAKDANGAPVANAKVTFSADGDCHIHDSHAERTTDANGVATYTFGSYEPCKASVVAASVGANGVPVLSEVSYVYFEEDHPHYAKERDYYGEEREYYKRGHPRYAEERLS